MQNPAQGVGAAAGLQVPPQGQQVPRWARNPAKWSQLANLDYGNKQDCDYYKIAIKS